MDFLGALSGFLKFLSLNSILQQEIHDRIVYCDRLEEEGIIHLQVRRGIIPLSRLIPFNMPSNSRKVIVRIHLSFYLRDILDFDERRLEIYKKEYMRENIKVYDDRRTLIEASLERLYQKNGIRLEGDISWLTDINPNERKIFKILDHSLPNSDHNTH